MKTKTLNTNKHSKGRQGRKKTIPNELDDIFSKCRKLSNITTATRTYAYYLLSSQVFFFSFIIGNHVLLIPEIIVYDIPKNKHFLL